MRMEALKQKIGQMLLIGFKGAALTPNDDIVEAILAQEIGGVILFDYNFTNKTYQHNILNPVQVQQLTSQLQDYTRQAAEKNHMPFLPLLIGIDYEGGKVNRLKESYGFPETLSPHDVAQLSEVGIKEQAEKMSKTLQQAGINLNFAPALDVDINPDCPVIGKLGRSFSKDPKRVMHCAKLFADQFRTHGIIPVYKHFPGHGSAIGDTHLGFVDVTETWKPEELVPYQAMLQSNDVVMTAHVVHYGLDKAGYPASLSYEMTQNLLRQQLKFTGLVITDDMQMKAVADNYGLEEAVCLAINAGADILVFGNQLAPTPQTAAELIDIILKNVESGKISESRINEAYERIVNLKSTLL